VKPPRPPPPFATLRDAHLAKDDFFDRVLRAGAWSATVGQDHYAHWDGLRHRTPPSGLSHEEWWTAIKLARLSSTRPLPLYDASRMAFKIANPDPLLRHLSEADRDLSGRMALPDPLLSPGTRDRYRISASIEEAITSSQLEGASTTRKVATEMLRSGRRPRDRSERMIFNNYQAMRAIANLQGKPLTPDGVRRLHRTVTDRTLDDPADAGRLRTSDDVKVFDVETNEILHSPPPHVQLPDRLEALCAFANEEIPEYYVHPIVRAILLHFLLAYDHPFVDGNGRTARALFYWSMARSGYWLCEYLSISHFLRKAPADYATSYLHTETDDGDTTYFVLSQLGVLKKAIAAMHDYVRLTTRAMTRTQSMLRRSHLFNHRQLAILAHAMQHPAAGYTATSHANSHQVTRQTARTDLKALAEAGLLIPIVVANGFVYTVPDDIEDRIGALGRKKFT
jgi:Fic family protein